jgi:hypothetical protein
MIGFDNQLVTNKESNDYHMGVKSESLTHEKNRILPNEWLKINIYPIEGIGFRQHHLIDIFETQLAEAEMVQESILHFAYGIEHESSKYKQYPDLLNLLIGRLRKGKPWFEQNYRSPQELAQAELLERKKNELERKKKIEEDIFKLALAEWQEETDPSELAAIAEKKGANDITPPLVKLSKYFRERIWPTRKKMYLIREE